MSQRYYPYVPWDDNPIHASTITHSDITDDILNQSSFHASAISREGIFGPLGYIFKYLCARDNLKLVADARTLVTYEPAN